MAALSYYTLGLIAGIGNIGPQVSAHASRYLGTCIKIFGHMHRDIWGHSSRYLGTCIEIFDPGISFCRIIHQIASSQTAITISGLTFSTIEVPVYITSYSQKCLVRPFVTFFTPSNENAHTRACALDFGSHGLSAQRARWTKSRRPEGPQTRRNFQFNIICFVLAVHHTSVA